MHYLFWFAYNIAISWIISQDDGCGCVLSVFYQSCSHSFHLRLKIFWFSITIGLGFYWRAERVHLVVQLARFLMDFGPETCPRATRKHNRPCLFRSRSIRSSACVEKYFSLVQVTIPAMSSYRNMTEASDDVLTSWGESRSFSEEPFHPFGDATAAHPVRADRSRGFIDPEVYNMAGISQNSVKGKNTVTGSSPRYVTAPRSAHYSHVQT